MLCDFILLTFPFSQTVFLGIVNDIPNFDNTNLIISYFCVNFSQTHTLNNLQSSEKL